LQAPRQDVFVPLQTVWTDDGGVQLVPCSTGVQVPTWPCAVQVPQPNLQALSQQTPETQSLLWQSVACPHGCPFATEPCAMQVPLVAPPVIKQSLLWHCWLSVQDEPLGLVPTQVPFGPGFWQNVPSRHMSSAVQLVGQLVEVPLQKNCGQAVWPIPPCCTVAQVPSAPPVSPPKQEAQGAVQALSQQMPSPKASVAQCRLWHWLSLVQLVPFGLLVVGTQLLLLQL
jgi:hypothetical protein